MAIPLMVLWYNESQGKSPTRCFSKRAMRKKRRGANARRSTATLWARHKLYTDLEQAVHLPQNDDNEVQTVPGISEVSVIMENKST